jgi:CheY-like chemotaxis protein
MLSASDTGEGMDAQTQAQPVRAFLHDKEEGKGTGLGLATVFGIVSQSGGHVSVYSEPGVGTTFRTYFPRVQDALSRPTEALPGTLLPQGTETILLVEDSNSLRVMIREILEGAGYTVLEFSDPELALAKVSTMEAPVSIMVTDVVMPRLSGPDLARAVRKARPEVKLLFMSGYSDEAMGLHGMLDADTRFIQKPFTADALLRKVRETLDER